MMEALRGLMADLTPTEARMTTAAAALTQDDAGMHARTVFAVSGARTFSANALAALNRKKLSAQAAIHARFDHWF